MRIEKITKSKRNIIIIGVIIVIIFGGTINLDRIPPVWWDEGWTMNIARNWAELGHYGHLINGRPRSPGLTAELPVVVPVALSFRLFGVGVWQGRLPGVLFFFSNLALIFYLADRMYNRAIAYGSLFVLILMSGPLKFHPFIQGRMVMGEMPMLFYLLSGYSLFYLSMRKSILLIIPAALLWGVGINSKIQPPPFWLISLLLPLVLVIIKRWWKEAFHVTIGILLAWFTSSMLKYIETSYIVSILSEPLPGIIQTIAIVLKPGVRLATIGIVLLVGVPTLIGILYAAWRAYRTYTKMAAPVEIEILRLTILSFIGSWLAWYILLSIGYERYLFPVIFVGSIFTSAFLYKLTQGFNIKSTFQNATKALTRRRDRTNLGALLALALVAFSLSITIRYSYFLNIPQTTPIAEITDYIENISQPDDLIETYESELFFLLDRPYHFPPDILIVQILTRQLSPEDVVIDYDPLEAEPDFLVVGDYGGWTQLYEPYISSGEFKLVKSFPDYEIYARDEH